MSSSMGIWLCLICVFKWYSRKNSCGDGGILGREAEIEDFKEEIDRLCWFINEKLWMMMSVLF